MSWPCAQVSMIRAVSEEATLMAGPNQGSRAAGSRSAKTVISSARARPNQSSSCAGGIARYRRAIASGSTAPVAVSLLTSAANSSGSVAEVIATWSK